jgi:hypothetical protein
MENTNLSQPETEAVPKPVEQHESDPEADIQIEPKGEPLAEPEVGSTSYVNENITRAFDRVKLWFLGLKEHYLRSPRLRKVVYQGKFMPAFWTVTAIFSLLVNLFFIALLISIGRYFFEFKSLVSEGLVEGISANLALMDKAHIVATIPVETTVQLQDSIPVVFDLPINENTQVTLSEDTRIPGATIYLNNTAVLTDLDLPAGTPLNFSLNTTVPVSQSVPVDVTVPVSLLVPLDLAIEQTDLHQSIVGLKDDIEPYKTLLGSTYTSPGDFPICNAWWSGWLCGILFGEAE